MLFDWLVTGHVLDVNPAHAARGPEYVVKKGKTPVLGADEARMLLDSIKVATTVKPDGTERQEPVLVGLRDRALIGVTVYTFARINAVLEMKVGAITSSRDATPRVFLHVVVRKKDPLAFESK